MVPFLSKSAKLILFGVTLLYLFTFYTSKLLAQNIDPQYIFVRKDPMTCNPSDCSMLWNMDSPSQITAASINDVFTKIGTRGNASGTRKVGIAVYYNMFVGADVATKTQSLRALLNAAQTNDFPVYVAFDAWVWMDNRPDLWNWWDSTRPGYNPANVNNVEWTCWDPSCAIKKSWRNWGAEFEVKPQPNLASPAVINAAKEALGRTLPVVADWYNALPENKKYLLGGIDIGGEVDIGANYYYYPNGVSNGTGLPGSIQLGYNAVKTARIKSSGTLSGSDIDEVARRYQTTLNKLAYDAGIPRQKIFNHSSAKGYAPFIVYPAGVAFTTPYESLNNYAFPGWSFYGEITSRLANYGDLNSVLNQAGNSEWAVPEWLTFAQDYNGWVDSLRKTLGYRNNRLLNVANWEAVRNNTAALSAIKTVANENPACWVTTPYSLNTSVSGNTATLTWQKGANNAAVYLNVTTSSQFNYTGAYTSANIFNGAVTSQNSQVLTNLSPGRYNWLLAADGCTNQRKIAYGTFTIGSQPVTPTPTRTPTPAPVSLAKDSIGIYSPTNSIFNLKNSNASGNADLNFNFGVNGDIPLTGDWDGNGTDTIGIFRNNTFYLKNSNSAGNAEISFQFGIPGDVPIAGDWDGNGTDTVGIYRNGTFYLKNSNSSGFADITIALGNTGDIPLAGDWDGNGRDTVGVFRPSTGIFYLTNSNSSTFAEISFGFGNTFDKPIVGDWNNDGRDTVGVFRNGNFYLNNSNSSGNGDLAFQFGSVTDTPLAGNWDGRSGAATNPPTPHVTITPTPVAGKPGDVNGDGSVNVVDIGIIIDNYGQPSSNNPRADLTHDNIINILDIGIVVDNYGR